MRPTDTEVRIPLAGTETIAEIRALGVSEAAAYAGRKRGYVCPRYNQCDYPQLDGPGGFADLYDPQGFVVNLLARTVRTAGAHLDPETFRDWTQELLMECWRRRHAPHVQRFVPYYHVMVKGLVRQWLCQRAKELARLVARKRNEDRA